MIRYITWQATLALLGVALAFGILFQLNTDEPTIEVPTAGGTYTEGVLGYWGTINPILAPQIVPGNPADQDLAALVFDGLTTLDEAGQVVPMLATDWDLSEDGHVYEFHLRREVNWNDDAPFTAADVAFTVQAMQDPNFQGDPALRELWRNVTVEQVDSLTVRFTLEDPFPSFIYYTTIGLLPAHLLGNVAAADLPTHEFSTRQPVGTGMFQVESVQPDRVVLVANPSYWGSKPYMERLELWFYGDENGLLVDYDRGAVQGFHPSDPQAISSLARLRELEIYSAPSAGYGIVYLNLERDSVPFFREKEVRQALLYALDRQALIDKVLAGQGLVASSPIVPIVWAHDPTVRQYGYDPQRAIGLLDTAGWLDSDADRIRDRDGSDLAFTLLASDDMVQLAEELARQWREVGVEVTVQAVGPEVATDFVRTRNYDAALTEVVLTADPDPYPLWHSTQAGEPGQNFSGFANQDADALMEEARSTVDEEKRGQLLSAFQRIFAEEVPSLLLYYPIYTYAVDAQVREVQLSPLLHGSQRFRNISDWYIQTEEVAVSENGELDKTSEQ